MRLVISTHDLLVVGRSDTKPSVDRLRRQLAHVGIELVPATAALSAARSHYVPVRVTLGDEGVTIRTGFWIARTQDVADLGILDRAAVAWTVSARPTTDPNELPIAWLVAAALAELCDGVIFDPQHAVDVAPSEVPGWLARHGIALDPAAPSPWLDYPYEAIRALEQADDATARDLVRSVSDASARDADGSTLLMVAIRHRRGAIARDLLDRGVDVDRTNRYGRAAIDEALDSGDRLLVGQLLRAGADASRLATALANNGDADAVGLLLDAGLDVETSTPRGWTLLMIATWAGHAELARRLVARGADLDRANDDGWTAITLAVERGDARLVRDLVAEGDRLGRPSPFADACDPLLPPLSKPRRSRWEPT